MESSGPTEVWLLFLRALEPERGMRSSPPYLTLLEKRWITFQLLQALVQCHSQGWLELLLAWPHMTPVSSSRGVPR